MSSLILVLAVNAPQAIALPVVKLLLAFVLFATKATQSKPLMEVALNVLVPTAKLAVKMLSVLVLHALKVKNLVPMV